MESIIWALDLVAVAYLCLWALRTDKARTEDGKDKQAKTEQGSKNA